MEIVLMAFTVIACDYKKYGDILVLYIIPLQHMVKFCVSVRSHFELKTNIALLYFSFSGTIKAWAAYKYRWKILK